MEEQGKPNRNQNKTIKDVCAELHDVFEDILHVVAEVSEGYTVAGACRRHNISASKFSKILSSRSLATCRDDDSVLDLQESPSAFYDGYDELYRAVFNIPKKVEYERPPDYIETVDTVLEALNKDQQTCIRNRFRLDGGEPVTYAQTGQTLGLSANQVQGLTRKTIDRLHFPPYSYQLAYGNDIWYAMKAAEKAAHARKKAEMVRQMADGTITTSSCPISMLPINEDSGKKTETYDMHGEGQEREEANIDQLGLSTKVHLALQRSGYTTIQHVCEAEDSELRKCKGLGAIGVKEIREKCRAYMKSQAPGSFPERTGDDMERGDGEVYDGAAVPIERLGLSEHVMNALKGARLLTLRALMIRTDKELLMVSNFGVYGLSDVRIACERYIEEHPSAAVPDNEDKSCPRVNLPLNRLDSTQCQYLYADAFGEAVVVPEDWEDTIAYVFDTILIKRERILLTLYYNSRKRGVRAAEKEVAVVLGTNATTVHRAMTVIFRRLQDPACANILRNGVGSVLAGEGQ